MADLSSLRQSASRSVRVFMSSSVGSTSMVGRAASVLTLSAWHNEARCSSKWSISSRSACLKVPLRLNISSQSTRLPSNSGPSMHTKRVFPPMVSRQAPHMPVPSTMMVLSDTSLGMLCFCAKSEQNFIMMGGPIAKILSTCSCCTHCSMPSVTRPFCP